MTLLLLLYVLLLFYGSWYPFAWQDTAGSLLAFLDQPLPHHWDKGDIVQNVLVYMPFGLLMVARHGVRRLHAPSALLLAAVCGTVISLVIECGQQYLPARVPSLLDVAMNLIGSIAGGLLGMLASRHTVSGAALLALRDAWFRPGPLASTGLVTLGLWFLAQTSPLVPSLDIAQLRHALGYLLRSVASPAAMDVGKLATLLCYQAGLGLLLGSLLVPGRPLLRGYCLLMAFVCTCKLLVAGRVLSLELLLAAALVIPLLAWLRGGSVRGVATCGIAALAIGLTIYERLPGSQPVGLYVAGFNWIPFAGQMENLSGLENILEFLWPTMAMACLLRQALPFHRQDAGMVLGTVAVAAGMFTLEWQQQWVPGRHGDITQVVLACAGWIVPWCVRTGMQRPAAQMAAGRH